MALTLEDRLSIHELVNLHGHLMDAGAFDRLNDIFAADVVYDLKDFGQGELRGIAAVQHAAVALGDGNPLGHHVTNVVIGESDGATVRVISKGIGIRADGSSGTVVYTDEVQRTPDGWRIVHRTVTARRKPLHP